MLAHMLSVCGLNLGPASELLAANEFNADGYWENRRFVTLNDRILEFLGGSWDMPPASPGPDDIDAALEALRAPASDAIRELGMSEPWGWKDPRTSLTLDFWRRMFPDLKIVVCVRHPTEVALSLQRRGAMSPALGLRLWARYNAQITELDGSHTHVLTHYGSYFGDPRPELRRVLSALEMSVAEELVSAAAETVDERLRHHQVETAHASISLALPQDVGKLYAALRERSGGAGRSELTIRTEPWLGLSGEMETLQSHDRWRAQASQLAEDRDRWRAEAERLRDDRDAARANVERLTRERDSARTDNERLTGERETERGELADLARERDSVRAEITALSAQRQAQRSETERAVSERDTARAQLERLAGEHEARGAELERVVAERDEAQVKRGHLIGEHEARGAQLERVRDERDAARAQLQRLAGEHKVRRAELERVILERDAAQNEASSRADERDHWQAKAKLTSQDRHTAKAQGERLSRERNDAVAEAERLARDRDVARREASALALGLDRSRDELQRLTQDRDNWRARAEKWIDEAKGLRERDARRPTRRLRRAPRRLAAQLLQSWRVVTRAVTQRLPSGVRQDGVRAPLPPGSNERAPGSQRLRLRRAQSAPVSVVIPTRNAGPEFGRVLAAIRSQQGVEGLEIVIADSGSTDETRQIAERAGAHILTIPPDEFGHGRTRNIAAEAANGEVLLMMVQDAFLLGRTAISEMLASLRQDDGMAALSARQVPRTDADLYGAYGVWAHGHTIVAARQGMNGHIVDLEALEPIQRRAMAPLDDVCSTIRRSVWDDLRFADVEFAEDLEMGLRAVRRGWRIGLSESVTVAHSHTRDSTYQLRRSVADRIGVAPLIGDNHLSPASEADVPQLLAAGQVVLAQLAGTIDTSSRDPSSLADWLRRIQAALESRPPHRPPADEGARLAALLSQWSAASPDSAVVDALRTELVATLGWPPLLAFASAYRSVDSTDVSVFVIKLAGSVVGRVVGDSLRRDMSQPAGRQLLRGV